MWLIISSRKCWWAIQLFLLPWWVFQKWDRQLQGGDRLNCPSLPWCNFFFLTRFFFLGGNLFAANRDRKLLFLIGLYVHLSFTFYPSVLESKLRNIKKQANKTCWYWKGIINTVNGEVDNGRMYSTALIRATKKFSIWWVCKMWSIFSLASLFDVK